MPPWPEAIRANESGCELENQLGLPFFFSSPDRPDDTALRWWDSEAGSHLVLGGRSYILSIIADLMSTPRLTLRVKLEITPCIHKLTLVTFKVYNKRVNNVRT